MLKRIEKKFSPHSKTSDVKKLLENDSGEANYFSTVVFIFITVLLLAFIIDLFGIISTKQQLDLCADQMVKQIQLSGGINGETDALFQFLCGQVSGASNISYTIDASYRSPTPAGMNRAIQLGNPFYINIAGDAFTENLIFLFEMIVFFGIDCNIFVELLSNAAIQQTILKVLSVYNIYNWL